MPHRQSDSIDFQFAVPLTHRLRVTSDVSGDDFAVLRSLLQTGDGSQARVLVAAESSVASTSDRVQRLSEKLAQSDLVDIVCPTHLVDGGEPIKNTDDAVQGMLRLIHENNLDRRSYIIAVGGGAFLDAIGYAAAIAHRGIRLIRLPTTTLAQADSGVGVKNAINYFGKKNWVGTFAVPWAVVNDSALLKTLPDREFVSGFSEAVKVSLLKDAQEFDWLCEHAGAIVARDVRVSRKAIHRSCMLHLKHITEGGDPFEMLEARPLDFGHWSAHKLESLAQYTIRHGEAVAIGVAIDCLYSSLMFGFPKSEAYRAIDCLESLGIELWNEHLNSTDKLLDGLEEFRQHLGGRLTVTMLQKVGKPIDVHTIDSQVMAQAIMTLAERVHSSSFAD